jgi:L-ascorbate metabolism protein UlaG (beta-lactamase superfamily)
MLLIIIISIVLALIIIVYAYMRLPKFGAASSGERLQRIHHSPNFKNGQFQNLSVTPSFTEGATMGKVMKEFFFVKSPGRRPPGVLPSQKIDLHVLDPDSNVLVWFGHSSYFMQIDRKKFLVDPVLSGHASPFKFTTKSFPGSDVYTVDEIPSIDYLIITHDHWDHLDYETVTKLKPRIGKIITGLGVGAHLERWGFDQKIIFENDWNEELMLEDGFKVHSVPARHFSGRTFLRNRSLWLSFILTTPSMKIFVGGDSGYDTHFENTGNEFGPFDLAILECGQYNKSWKYIHMMPEEVVQAAIDLKAKVLLPVHWSKFSLSLHDWNEPILRVVKESKKKNVTTIHPLIGEAVDLKNIREYATWWDLD